MRRIKSYFQMPLSVARVDDRHLLRGIISAILRRLRWPAASQTCGPHETLHSRFIHVNRLSVFERIFEASAAKGGKADRPTTGVTHFMAHSRRRQAC